MHKPKITKTMDDFDTSTLNEEEQEIVNGLTSIVNKNKEHHTALKAKVKELRSEAKEVQVIADKLNSNNRRR